MNKEKKIILRKGQVQVYIFDLKDSKNEITSLINFMSSEEKEKAFRFRFENDRNRFVIGRGKLREILSYQLATNPQKISIDKTSFGKPYLVSYPNLFFNISHSEEKVLIAISYDNEIGIDIEKIDLNFSFKEILSLYLTKNELEILTQYKNNVELLTKVWVRKEACLKAYGIGLSYPLTEICVPLQNKIVKLSTIANKFGDWYLKDLEVENYAVTLVMQKKSEIIELR